MTGRGDRDTRFARNVVAFCRTLRAAGLPVGPARIADTLDALARVGVERRVDVYAALRAVLVADPRHFDVFDRAFRLFFERPSALARRRDDGTPDSETDRSPGGADGAPPATDAAGGQAAGTASEREAFRHKDFEDMSPEEECLVMDYLRQTDFPRAERATRRYSAHRRGDRYDLRRTLAAMPRSGGEITAFAKRRRRRRPTDLVLLCDVSGSMSRYTRAFLMFAHAIARRRPGVRAFVFGTRLTPIDRHLAVPGAARALAHVAAAVDDFDGGTRIAACLGRFNRDRGRRLLARGATVVLLSDGLERQADGDLGRQMALLRRSCRHLVWLNPMLRYPGFEPLAAGVRAMLPHVDRFLPAHNLDCFDGLCRALADAGRTTGSREAA